MGEQENTTITVGMYTNEDNEVVEVVTPDITADIAFAGVDGTANDITLANTANVWEDAIRPLPNVEPFDIVTINRINDILRAINSGINAPRLDRNRLSQITLWATELNAQINLLDTMMIYDT